MGVANATYSKAKEYLDQVKNNHDHLFLLIEAVAGAGKITA